MKIGDSPIADPGRIRHPYGTGTERQAREAVAGLPEVGQLLKGRVVTVDAAGVLTVETEFGFLKATAAATLPVGRESWFQVVQGGGSPLLAEAGKTNAVLNLLRIVLPGLVGAGPSAGPESTQEQAVRAFLEGHAMDGRPDPVKLAKTMAQFCPSPPREGKAALPLGAELGGAESPILQKARHLVEAHAMVNQPGGSAGCDYVIFPVFFAEQAGKGEWLFSFDRQTPAEEAGGEIATLSFYLAMSRLGDVHISLATRPQTLSGVITVASEEAASHVRQYLPPLVQALERLTEGTAAITCRCGPVDCLKALKEDLTAKLGQVDRYALIDIRA